MLTNLITYFVDLPSYIIHVLSNKPFELKEFINFQLSFELKEFINFQLYLPEWGGFFYKLTFMDFAPKGFFLD